MDIQWTLFITDKLVPELLSIIWRCPLLGSLRQLGFKYLCMCGTLGCMYESNSATLSSSMTWDAIVQCAYLYVMPCPATTPLCKNNVLVSVRASLLVCCLELRGVHYSGVQLHRKISRWKGQMFIRRRCPLFGVSVIRGSTVYTSIVSRYASVHSSGDILIALYKL